MILCWTAGLILLAFLVGIVVGYPSTNETLCALRVRIKELGDKSTQVLLFLSFAIAAVVFLGYGQAPGSPSPVSLKIVQGGALLSWVSAIFPVIVGVLPLKEFGRNNLRWYRIVRWFKFWLLWIAIAYIVCGAVKFYRAI
jgi:hypothetical protein